MKEKEYFTKYLIKQSESYLPINIRIATDAKPALIEGYEAGCRNFFRRVSSPNWIFLASASRLARKLEDKVNKVFTSEMPRCSEG